MPRLTRRTILATSSRHLSVPGNIRLRIEHFGGLALNTRSGTIVELDRDAMRLLLYIRGAAGAKDDDITARFPSNDVGAVLGTLLEMGIISTCEPNGVLSDKANEPDWPPGPHLTAPETVHWAITYRCGQDCPDCYARPHRAADHREMDTSAACELVDRLAAWGVLQLAIGGGEPLQRPDLVRICEHARDRGLVVHVTTGSHMLSERLISDLAGSLVSIQIGVKHDQLLGNPGREVGRLSESIRRAQSAGTNIGVNLMLSNTVMARFDEILGYLVDAGIQRLTLLRYKPTDNETRWLSENPSPRIWHGFERVLREARTLHTDLQFRTDCSLSFLQRSLDPEVADAHGVRGCVAGSRILAITPEADAYPCSQLVRPELFAGNLLTDAVESVWSASEPLNQCRAFRDTVSFRTGRCGTCGAANFCGGCRVFASELSGPDPGCPRVVCSEEVA